MKNENTKLKLEIEKLKAKAITISEIEKELKELKKVVNLGDSSDTYKYIEKVQGYDNSIYDSFILISAKQEKTKQGAVVISNEGLVGLVYDSKNSMARVLNLTNQKMFVPGVTDKECHLILRGTGKNELISVEIMDNTISNLEIGDIIYTSGEGGTFSKGIPVAEITEINKDKSEILAKPTVNLDKLSFVWITDPVVTNMKNELPNDLL
jgi:rod shape-determining protein MreC